MYSFLLLVGCASTKKKTASDKDPASKYEIFNNNQKLLLVASRYGDLKVVKALIKDKVDINYQNKKEFKYRSKDDQFQQDTYYTGETALMSASSEGHLDIVNLLLKKKANIHEQNSIGWTALMHASYNGHLDVVKLLLKHGANVNVTDDLGWTPLMVASYYGNKEVLVLLLKNGADISARRFNGWTPLMVASRHGNTEAVELFINNEADQTLKTKKEYQGIPAELTACEIAKQSKTSNKKTISLLCNDLDQNQKKQESNATQKKV